MFSEFWHTRVGVFKICIFNRTCYTLIFTIFKGPYVTHILYSSFFFFLGECFFSCVNQNKTRFFPTFTMPLWFFHIFNELNIKLNRNCPFVIWLNYRLNTSGDTRQSGSWVEWDVRVWCDSGGIEQQVR